MENSDSSSESILTESSHVSEKAYPSHDVVCNGDKLLQMREYWSKSKIKHSLETIIICKMKLSLTY